MWVARYPISPLHSQVKLVFLTENNSIQFGYLLDYLCFCRKCEVCGVATENTGVSYIKKRRCPTRSEKAWPINRGDADFPNVLFCRRWLLLSPARWTSSRMFRLFEQGRCLFWMTSPVSWQRWKVRAKAARARSLKLMSSRWAHMVGEPCVNNCNSWFNIYTQNE